MNIKNAYQYNNFLKDYDLTLNDYIYAKRVKQYDEEGNVIPALFDSERFNLVKELNSKHHKEMKARWEMRKRIVARVLDYDDPYFVTITFRDEALNRDYERNIKEMLKRYGLNKWCFITDYGEENGRLHYHGFIDLKSADMGLFVAAESKKYISGVCFKPMTKNFGFNLFTPIDKECVSNTIAYCVKYATKTIDDLKFEHKMFCSRSTKQERLEKRLKEIERQEEIMDLLFA